MKDPNCVFCKIVEKHIPASVTYEDDDVIAFLDIHPSAPGHTLLIPKEHHEWFIDMPDELSDKVFRAAKKISQSLKQEYRADYIRLAIVGTDVPHVHIHLIPQEFKSPKANI